MDVRGHDECWPWLGARHADGHGRLGIGRRVVQAHRVAWMLEHGEVPDGEPIAHADPCADPSCQNPRHLYRAEADELARRAAARLPHPSGDAHPRAKLTDAQVAEVRRRRAAGERGKDLAREYGVSDATISLAVRRGKG